MSYFLMFSGLGIAIAGAFFDPNIRRATVLYVVGSAMAVAGLGLLP